MFRSTLKSGFDKRRLRLLLSLLFVALAVPTVVLIYQAYSQLKWEAFHQHRVMAEELAGRIDARFTDVLETEEARSFADYAFLSVAGDPSSNFLQRSPLSSYPVASDVPGLLGYFQVDAEGGFSTPLLPQDGAETGAYGIAEREYAQRLALQQQIQRVLNENRLVRGRPADDVSRKLRSAAASEEYADLPGSEAGQKVAGLEQDRDYAAGEGAAEKSRADDEIPAQVAFDQLRTKPVAAEEQTEKKQRANILGRVEDLQLDAKYESKSRSRDRAQQSAMRESAAEPGKRAKRKEQISLPEPQRQTNGGRAAAAPAHSSLRISTFESEIDPFDFSMLDSGHFVLFRKVWREGQRYIQGALIEQQPFVEGVIESEFRNTALSRMSDLIVAYQGDVFSALGGQTEREYLRSSQELTGALLYQTSLSAPLGEVELIFTITTLPAGPGGSLISWVTVILAIVLCGGFYIMYRAGAGQIELARQQQDFVSAVSHELKTPLTSIRMYGEMLREGWADKDKRQTYYDFIYDESERLSRLITNVLQLARMTRNDPQFDLKPVTTGELIDTTESKISSQVQRAGFRLETDQQDDARETVIVADTDCFTQIVINLVDNAIKFSANADRKVIELASRKQTDGTVVFTVRDFGPGVPKGQMKKIFKLFYRSESELTRETVGTGIGLALVHQLAIAMDGRVDVRNREPGAEFSVSFPVAAQERAGSPVAQGPS